MCRLSYAQSLFKARSADPKDPNARKRFGCTLIFPKADRAFFEKEIAKLIREQWGDKGIDMAKSGMIKNPLLAGDGKEARVKTGPKTGELHAGMSADVFFIRVASGEDRPPWVRWRDANRQETEETVYSGCYGKAVVNMFTWTHPTNGSGISFGIQGFQKHGEGERLSGGEGADPTKWVETIEDTGPISGGDASGLFGE
jgi:hypothetical protein